MRHRTTTSVHAALFALLLVPAVPDQSRRVSVIPDSDSTSDIQAEVKGSFTKTAAAFQISASGLTWEVDVSADDTLREAAERIVGQRAIVRGTLVEQQDGNRTRRVLAARTLAAATQGDRPEYVDVTIRGIVKTGIMAIGAETTGATITSGAITWELELDRRQAETASALNGKTALVSGQLRSRSGVEVRTRTILTVRTIA